MLIESLVEFDSRRGGFRSILELAFELLRELFLITLSGMPGIGVGPFGRGLPRFFESGMPGIGVVPFGKVFTLEFGSGMPGGKLDIGTGLAENSDGILALVAPLTFSFGASILEQAKFTENRKPITAHKTFFDIRNNPILKFQHPTRQTNQNFTA